MIDELVIKLSRIVNYIIGNDFKIYGSSVNYNTDKEQSEDKPQSAAISGGRQLNGLEILGITNLILLAMNVLLMMFLLRKRKNLSRSLALEYNYQPPTAPSEANTV